MPIVVVALLAMVWIYLSYNAFSAGNTGGGFLFLVIGVVLTVYRLKRQMPK